MKQTEDQEVLGPRVNKILEHSNVNTSKKLIKFGITICSKCKQICSDQDTHCKKCKLRLKYDIDFKL